MMQRGLVGTTHSPLTVTLAQPGTGGHIARLPARCMAVALAQSHNWQAMYTHCLADLVPAANQSP